MVEDLNMITLDQSKNDTECSFQLVQAVFWLALMQSDMFMKPRIVRWLLL